MESNPFIIRCKCNSAILEFINFSNPMPKPDERTRAHLSNVQTSTPDTNFTASTILLQ